MTKWTLGVPPESATVAIQADNYTESFCATINSNNINAFDNIRRWSCYRHWVLPQASCIIWRCCDLISGRLRYKQKASLISILLESSKSCQKNTRLSFWYSGHECTYLCNWVQNSSAAAKRPILTSSTGSHHTYSFVTHTDKVRRNPLRVFVLILALLKLSFGVLNCTFHVHCATVRLLYYSSWHCRNVSKTLNFLLISLFDLPFSSCWWSYITATPSLRAAFLNSYELLKEFVEGEIKNAFISWSGKVASRVLQMPPMNSHLSYPDQYPSKFTLPEQIHKF